MAAGDHFFRANLGQFFPQCGPVKMRDNKVESVFGQSGKEFRIEMDTVLVTDVDVTLFSLILELFANQQRKMMVAWELELRRIARSRPQKPRIHEHDRICSLD